MMKENLLNSWIENTLKASANKNVLFLKANQGDTERIINNLKSIKYHCTIIRIEDLNESTRIPTGLNPIIISEGFYGNIKNMKRFVDKEIIYVEGNNTDKLIDLLITKSLDNNNEIRYDLLLKIDFESLLSGDKVSIENFVLDRFGLLNKLNCNFENIDIDFLIIHLTNYFNKKMLFASFAQLLYRLATLDFTSSAKKIGGNIYEIFGVHSKVVSPNKLQNLSIRQRFKNHRIYDLNEKPYVNETKINIAKKLVKLNIKELDIRKISKVTDLPLKEIERMYREAFLK